MQLSAIQSRLESIYDAFTPHRVEDFLLLDSALAAHLAAGCSGAARGTPEKLLVRQDGEDLDISLFLQQHILDRLERDNPGCRLHRGNLGELGLAVEGVSHFMHLVWAACSDRRVSCLELELLGEIDKFLVAADLALSQTGASHTRDLHRIQFIAAELREDLVDGERQRYYEANRLASRYCHSLSERYEMCRGNPALRQELRRFSRLSKVDKIHHIRSQPS